MFTFFTRGMGSVCPMTDEIKLMPYESRGKWGYFDLNGNIRIEPIYDQAGFFVKGLAPIELGGKWGLINEAGEVLIEPKYSFVAPFSDAKVLVECDNSIQIMDTSENVLNVYRYPYNKRAGFISDGIMRIEHNGRYGYIHLEEDVIIEPQYKAAGLFTNGLAWVEIDDEDWYYIDSFGNKKIQLSNSMSGNSFSEGLASVRDLYSLKGGYIDLNGNLVIGLRFGICDFFSEGYAAVSQNGKYGYINKNGEFVIEPKFDAAHPFIRGVAMVWLNGAAGMINREGSLILDLQDYSYIDMESYVADSDLLKVQHNEHFIYIRRQNGEKVFEVPAYK